MPDGSHHIFGDESSDFVGQITVHSTKAFNKMVTGETIGMADAYMAGEWDSPDLARMVEVILENIKGKVSCLRSPLPSPPPLPSHHRRGKSERGVAAG